MTTLMDPRDAIGHKIRWNSWDDGSYFILKSIDGKNLRGTLYSRYEDAHIDKFVMGKGIKLMSDDYKEVSYWYLLEELKVFKLSKFDDKLFEI
jgi:hypothetical protein